ncbi:Pre-rRNA-processing protein TSR2-domain-containing protein [Lentinula lateritia]|uniref:Pre-rRNA-processing protein TSR2-domain-containing protein n=1 Tax=Lentinula aff. lateritia TaxID=2804960 RepID=A0ACC1TVQ0_9AGAR|nr:Pre-rRNA-processing protein TSR2-domain-containing protein [Lentinula aff. lateritia]KAJ3854448.1 Pre-rRNA-processing protein TSR2-domain-containing protein [Lentinula lateritia]
MSSAPSLSLVLFARGVIARLALWETLALAVQESWGGPGAKEKRTWMAGVVVDMFEEKQSKTNSASSPNVDSRVEPEDIEDTLLQIMADEFEVHVEDGSAETLGKDIVQLWNAIINSASTGSTAIDYSEGEKMVQEWESHAESAKGRKIQAHYQEAVEEDGDWEDDNNEGDDEDGDHPTDEDEAPPLIDSNRGQRKPEIDEDGFTLVSSRRKW